MLSLDGPSKFLIALVDKVSDAGVGIARPYQIGRVAKAEAEAGIIRAESDAEVAKIRAESEIEVEGIRLRAARRFIEEETRKQANIESIIYAAEPFGNSDAAPQDMENDWVTNFFEKCRNVSDEEMQQVWVRILAGEANKPGSFSRKTVNVMADLDKADAEMFRNLCRFAWTYWGDVLVTPIVFDFQHEFYSQQGVRFEDCTHLETLGLVNMEGFADLSLMTKQITVSYDKRTIMLSSNDDKISMGHVKFTRVGLELYRICEVEPVDGFFEYVCDVWTRQKGLTVTPVAGAR